MKSFTITITGDCPDSVPDALILRAGAEASVPLLNPGDWMPNYEFLCTNIKTAVTQTTGQLVGGTGRTLRQMAEECAAKFPRTSNGTQKIQAIKELRSIAQIGLKEAKDQIDAVYDAVHDSQPF